MSQPIEPHPMHIGSDGIGGPGRTGGFSRVDRTEELHTRALLLGDKPVRQRRRRSFGRWFTDTGWRQLTWRFALFFTCMAILNEIVWRNVSEDLWIDFKVFGILGLTVLFSLSQMPLMKRYMVETDEAA